MVVDAGAHAGQFTRLLAGLASGGRVYAFEPGATARRILERVVRLKGFDNVEVVAAAQGDEHGDVTLTLPPKRRGSLGFGLAHLARAGSAPEEAWRRLAPLGHGALRLSGGPAPMAG